MGMEPMSKVLLRDPHMKPSFISAALVSTTVKIINCIVSCTLLLYYWISLGTNWKAVEFVQILFLSLSLVLVTVPLKKKCIRRLIACLLITVTGVWTYQLSVLWARDLNLSVAFQVMTFVCGTTWSFGIIVPLYLSERQNSNGEIDLILYLMALNVVTAWSPADTYNNELHLLLDMRTFMLVYNCLHRLQKNEELLRYPSFLSVVVITIVTFLTTQAVFSNYVGSAKEGLSIGTFLLFAVIGVTLMAEVWYSGKLHGTRDPVGGAGSESESADSDPTSMNGNGNAGTFAGVPDNL